MQDIITLGALVLAMWLLYWLQERRERRLVEAENVPLDLTVMFKGIDPGAHVLEVGLSASYSVTGTPVIPAAGGAWQGVALVEDGHPEVPPELLASNGMKPGSWQNVARC